MRAPYIQCENIANLDKGSGSDVIVLLGDLCMAHPGAQQLLTRGGHEAFGLHRAAVISHKLPTRGCAWGIFG